MSGVGNVNSGWGRLNLVMSARRPVSRACIAVAVIAATVVAAVLRLWCLRWGLPDAFHQLTYHPDEVFQIGAMLRVDLPHLSLDPGFYNYPSGYINLGSLAIYMAAGYGLNMDATLTNAYLTARSVTVLLGVLTVPIVYFAGARLYNRAVGLVAALIFAVIPLHVMHSHFATVDVPATFWVSLALLGSAMIASGSAGMKTYLLTGIAAGIAAGTKYNAGLVLLPIIVAYIIREQGTGDREQKSVIREQGTGDRGQKSDPRPPTPGSRLLAVFGAFIVGFLASTPAFLIQPGKYIDGFMYELRHAAAGHGLVFTSSGPGWLYVLKDSLGYGLGPVLLVFTLMAVVFAVVRRTRSDWLMLSFLAPYYLLISFSEVHFARYAIPILPVIAIFAGRMAVEIYQMLKGRSLVLGYGWIAVCTAIILYTSVYAVAVDRLFTPPDPRNAAAAWFESNVQPGTTIGLPAVPWFYSPPFDSHTTAARREQRYMAMSESRYNLLVDPDTEWNPSIIRDGKPEYIVITDFEYEDPLRLHLVGAEEFMRELDKSYKCAAVFTKRISAFGIDFGSTERLPHDLKYMSPTIRVYRRK